MKLFVILLLPLALFASQILSYNVYDRSERVDIMLTFDTPYDGTIRQQKQSGSIIVKLENATIEAPKSKDLNSPFLNKLTITPIGSQTQIIARVPNGITMQASKTADAYGLRLRFLKKTASATSKSTAPSLSTPSLVTLPTKQGSALEENYMSVIVILVVGILILLWLKRSLNQGKRLPSQSSLFKPSDKGDHDQASIRFQKNLDQNNSVMMLDYADESYLVIVGNSNVVLDKFHGNKPITQSEFESVLQNKEEELDSYLQIDNVDSSEVLQSYKEKASQ
jgi:hypothetical protein